MTLKPFVLGLVAQLSSRLFVGTDLCRNKEWLHLAKNYTLDSFGAGRALRRQPMALRPLMVWLLPEWRKVRQDVKDARRILAPVINARLERNRLADEKGVPRPRTKDTIQVSPEVRAMIVSPPFSLNHFITLFSIPFWLKRISLFSSGSTTPSQATLRRMKLLMRSLR